MSQLVIPAILCAVGLYGAIRRVDVYGALTKGAEEGLTVLLRILPSLVALLTAIAMFRASGAMEWFAGLLSPLLTALGIPPETAPLLIIRPISGSGALAVGAELMERCGVDSYAGRVAAVMLGSSETTFYTVAIYCGAAGIVKTRYTIPAALCADAAMFLLAAFAVRLFFTS
ncbi:MAG: spore maturation protein [Oscillospiraceae bacterium]|nr:spore maturation protein [Oscillospiraceae bacterium]